MVLLNCVVHNRNIEGFIVGLLSENFAKFYTIAFLSELKTTMQGKLNYSNREIDVDQRRITKKVNHIRFIL